MIYLLIPEEEIQKIEEERFDCLDPQISRRLHALYLKSKSYSHNEISDYVGLSLNGLTKIFKKYASGGLEEVKKMHYTGKQSVLDDYREQIRAHFKENPPTSVKQACDDIEKLTGIKRGKECIRKFLHQIGMKPRKVGGIPAKADAQKQEDFKKKAWNLHYKKPKRARLMYILLMPLILCLVLFWLFCGLFRGFLLRPRAGEND
jgi:transposase